MSELKIDEIYQLTLTGKIRSLQYGEEEKEIYAVLAGEQNGLWFKMVVPEALIKLWGKKI